MGVVLIIMGIAVFIALAIILTGKNRRQNIIYPEIIKLVNSGDTNFVILHHVYYEAALKFAIENGADTKSPVNDNIDDSIHFSMNINGTNYFIYFARHIGGSIYLSVSDADEQRRQFLKRINSPN